MTLSNSPIPSASDLLSGVVMIIALTVTPWLFGGYYAWVQVWMCGATLVALVACFCGQSHDASQRFLPMAIVPLLIAITIGFLQLVPLDDRTLVALSPTAFRLWHDLLPSPTDVERSLAATTGPTESASPSADQSAQRSDSGPRPPFSEEWIASTEVRESLEAELQLASDLGVSAFRRRFPLSLYPASTRRDLMLLILATAAFAVGAMVFGSDLGARWLFCAMALNGFALAFFGIVQQMTWNGKLFWTVELTSGGAPFSSYVNKNNAAGLLAMCLACAVGLAVASAGQMREQSAERLARRSRSQSRNQDPSDRFLALLGSLDATAMFAVTAVICILAGIACSLSRGSWISVAGACVLLSVVTLRGRASPRRYVAAAAIGLVVIITCVALVTWIGATDRIAGRAATLVDEGADLSNARLSNWRDGAEAAWSFLRMGSGLGTYRYIYSLYQRKPFDGWFTHAENQYLEALVEMGLPGLSLMLWMIVLIALACRRLLQQPRSSTAYVSGIVGTLALTTQVLHACFDFGLYMPANFFLFAVLMGAITGQAVRTSRAFSSASTRFPPGSSPFVTAAMPIRIAGFVAGTLACGIVFGGLQLHGESSVQTALRSTRGLTSFDPSRPRDLAGDMQALSDAAACVPDQAEVQQQLARHWMARYRLAELSRIAGTQESPVTLANWRATDVSVLRAQIWALKSQNRTVELADLRQSRIVMDHLPQAVRHLLQARRSSPLFPGVHLALAQTVAAVTDPAQDELHLARARRVAPSDAQLWLFSGALDIDAQRTVAARQSWRHSLELAPQHLPKVLECAQGRIDLTSQLTQLLPDSPPLLFEAAEWLRTGHGNSAPSEVLTRQITAAISHARTSPAEKHYYLGRLERMNGAKTSAITELTRAVDLAPGNVHWRHELALALRDAGHVAEARAQAELCLQADPTNPNYEKLLRELVRAQLTSRRSSSEEG